MTSNNWEAAGERLLEKRFHFMHLCKLMVELLHSELNGVTIFIADEKTQKISDIGAKTQFIDIFCLLGDFSEDPNHVVFSLASAKKLHADLVTYRNDLARYVNEKSIAPEKVLVSLQNAKNSLSQFIGEVVGPSGDQEGHR